MCTNFILIFLTVSNLCISDAQYWPGGYWGGNGGHNGYGNNGHGYGSDICAGARQQRPAQQQQQTYPSHRYPEYGGWNNYHSTPQAYPHQPQPQKVQQPQQQPVQHLQQPQVQKVQQPQQQQLQQPIQHQLQQPQQQQQLQQPQVTPTIPVEYRSPITTIPATCSFPPSRDSTYFDQKCVFLNEYTQVSCMTRGNTFPTGTTALTSCRLPNYYNDNGDIIVEVCKDGKWHGDGKPMTCKTLATAPPTQQPVYYDRVVEYVQAPVVTTETPAYQQPEVVQQPVYEPTSTTIPTTTTTPTTTAKPYLEPLNIDWRTSTPIYDNGTSSQNSPTNDSSYCTPLAVKTGVTLECLSQSPRNTSGYVLSVSDCQDPQTTGTEATYKCQMYYEPVSVLTTQYRKCRNSGEWSGSDSDFACALECGAANPVGRLPLITFGEITVLGQWPWHAALFIRDRQEFTNACGGTLISQKAILTAAHCVNLYYSSLLRDLNDIRVDLGRYHRVKDDPYVQKFQIEKIVGHPAYNPWTYESDIAIIILKEPAKIGFHVRPVCFPRTQNSAFDELQLADGTYATVVGWGTDETGGSPDELRSAKLKVIGYKECIDSFEDSDTGALLAKSTTFCAGNKNGTNVCRGDSGSGAYFAIKTASGSIRWFLQGLVSVGINVSDGDKRCDPTKVSIFTRISPYSDWIVRILSDHDAL